MKLVGQAGKWMARLSLCSLALLCAGAAASPGQSSSAANPAPKTAATELANPAPPRIHGTVTLDGPWRFQIGDDPRWADPGFDDSGWQAIKLSQATSEQGIDTYTGYAWYRMRIKPEQLAPFSGLPGNQQIDLAFTPNWVGQFAVFLNGAEAGHTRGMTEKPSMYQSPPLVVHLQQPGADGTVVVAVRTWAGNDIQIRRGLLETAALGVSDDVAAQVSAARDQLWDHQLIGGLTLSLLFFCVALLGATLYLAQRKHPEYLWLSILCLSVAFMGASESAWALEMLPYAVFRIFNLWTGRIFMAVTLEFILRFTGVADRRLAHILQAIVMLLPILSLVGLEKVYEYSSVSSEVAFSALVIYLLFRAWRKGRPDAGVMLLPFFLAATADSLDTVLSYAVSQHWIPAGLSFHTFHIGPIEFPLSIVSYSVFLFSLLAVIFYRFIHVSQEEQRSSAEIEAARSVQAMLIPTELPSNHFFMLESAYLPANGVGGDFFQVLPLKDDSMLIVVGDVSGKGLQAAMNASTLVGALRNELSHDPATVLNRLNNVLLGATEGAGAVPNLKAAASFATCVCARVYPDGTMTISNAGHLHPYRDGRELDLPADLPLGVIPDMNYAQVTIQLTVGDRLIFLSDGVVEAANPQGELFGFERTQQVSNESARYIAQTAKRFGQTDDITVVSLYFAARAKAHAREIQPQQA